MSALLPMLSLLSAIVLTGTAASVFALYRAHLLVRQTGRNRVEPAAGKGGDMQDLRDAVEALAVRMESWEAHPPVAPEHSPASPRAGMNLCKRTQALRLHRQGQNVSQIATQLGVPRQEIDLMLKVNRIVLSNV